MTRRRLGGWLAVFALLAVATWLAKFERTNITLAPDASFELPAGAGAVRTVQLLREQGIVRDDPRWRWWVRLRQPGACLQAGRHTLPASATPAELFEVLCQPTRRASVRVTIPEGRTMFWVAEALAGAGLGDADTILDRLESPEFAASLGIDAPTLEGYLYPETYAFDVDAGATVAIARMVEHGREVRESLWAAHAASRAALEQTYGFGEREFLIAASIVEREAVVDDERPQIAAVIYNRLREGMRLQMDPTCTYGASTWQLEPTRALCRDPDNPTSTYVIDGLPPTPIASPGESSLRAVLAPADAPNLRYFVALGDGSGRHAFAETLAEHNANVAAYVERLRGAD
jgi:UPF0755 protein